MLNDNLVSLIKADKMLVNVKIHMTFALRLCWTVIIAFLILFFINIYHKQHIVINLFITIAVFLPLMWSVIRRRTQNKKIRSRYPYAFKSVVESYGLELVQGKGLSLLDTYLLSGYDERIFLCMEEMHKYQEDHQHPISPLLYKKKYYNKEEYDKEWNMILYYIRKVEGEDVIYTEDQVGMLCEKYKVWSEISKRMLTESWGAIFHDMSLNKEYTNQFLELLNRNFKDYTKKPDGLRDLFIIEYEIDNSLLHFNYVSCPQFAYAHILRYVDMKNGGVDDNEDFNREYRRMQKIMSSLPIYIMVTVTIVGGLLTWIATGTFGIGFVSAIGIGVVCMLLYWFYRQVLEHLLITKFKNHPTIMASIATMEGIDSDKVINSTSYLTESEIWKLLLVDGDLFKYPPLIIKPIRNSFVYLLEKYPNGIQVYLNYLSKDAQYRDALVSEKKEKGLITTKVLEARMLLCNLLDSNIFKILLQTLNNESKIRIFEANYAQAYADEKFIEFANITFEEAIKLYAERLPEWNLDVSFINFKRHNYDGSQSEIVLRLIDIYYLNWDYEISFADYQQRIETTRKILLGQLDNRITGFCDSIMGFHTIIFNEDRKVGGHIQIGKMIVTTLEKYKPRIGPYLALNNTDKLDDVLTKHSENVIFNIDYYLQDECNEMLQSVIQNRSYVIGIHNKNRYKKNQTCRIKTHISDSINRLNGSLPYLYLYSYIPVRFEEDKNFKLTKEEYNYREKIFRFKGVGFDERVGNEKDYYDLKLLLTESFDGLENAMFFFVPSKNSFDYEYRHKNLSRFLIRDFQATTSYKFVRYLKDGRSSRDGGCARPAQLCWGECFFKNKQIIMFDDIITSGHTMLHYKEMLERWGAKVIACIALGKTHYSHVAHPIDELKNIQKYYCKIKRNNNE